MKSIYSEPNPEQENARLNTPRRVIEPCIVYTIQSYTTGREHEIACESDEMMIRICENRFGYTHLPRSTYYPNGIENDTWMEPNWCVRSRRLIGA